MSTRDKLIIKVTLDLLRRMDQCNEEVLFYSVGRVIAELLMSEQKFALSHCEREGWAVAIKGSLDTNKWSITDKGKAALLEM